MPEDIYFDKLEDVQDWFKSGDSDANLKKLSEALITVIPNLKIDSVLTKRCIVSFTKHRKPYIGALNNNGLFIAAGGNGYAAMCADAGGRIAADLLINGVFPKEYPASLFEPVFQ